MIRSKSTSGVGDELNSIADSLQLQFMSRQKDEEKGEKPAPSGLSTGLENRGFSIDSAQLAKVADGNVPQQPVSLLSPASPVHP